MQQQAGVCLTESEQTTVCVQGNEETPCAAVWLIDVLHSFCITMELYGREKRATQTAFVRMMNSLLVLVFL